jgi:hypothetical protein
MTEEPQNMAHNIVGLFAVILMIGIPVGLLIALLAWGVSQSCGMFPAQWFCGG